MNIKNNIKILFMSLCIIAASTQCMFANILKTVLNGVSTAVAITLPNAIALRAVRNTYEIHQDPIAHIEKVLQCKTKAATEKEEQFLRPHVGGDVQIRTVPDYFDNNVTAATNGKVLVIPDRLPGVPITMTEVIESQEKNQWSETEYLNYYADAYIAAAQHEAGHVKNNDVMKMYITNVTLSIMSTAVGAKLFKILYPKDVQSGLIKTAKRSLTKCISGYALYLTTLKLSSELVKLREYTADDNVEESKRIGLAYCLDSAEFRENNPVDPAHKVDMNLRRKIDNWLLDDHPSNEQRKNRLQ